MLLDTLSRHWSRYQRLLFPALEDAIGPVTDRHQEIIIVLDVLRLERSISDGPRCSTGRRPASRLAIARAFVAKAVLNLPTTLALIDRLRVDAMLRRICGFESWREIPTAATFSNAFREFSEGDILSRLHEALVRQSLKDELIGHVSRDATEIKVRERSTIKKTPGRKKKIPTGYRRGPAKKGEVRVYPPRTRIEKQMTQSLDEMVTDLPIACDSGSKRGSSGHIVRWFGYKLHLDVDDNGVPLTCLLTSASVNDSQVAIPLETMTSQRVVSLYSVMDKGYDSERIREFVASRGKVPIIDYRRRNNGTLCQLDPAKAVRYRVRSTVERTFSELKDNLGCRQVRVRGAPKVMTHVMFGVLALTALGLLQYWA